MALLDRFDPAASYPLDTAIGSGNTNSAHWTGGNSVADLYTLTPIANSTNYSGFIVTNRSAGVSTGYGVIVARCTFSINGQNATVENTYSLGSADAFLQVVTRLTNSGQGTISNTNIWVGTRDDHVGGFDRNVKTRGNFAGGAFVAATTTGQQANAIMVTSSHEGGVAGVGWGVPRPLRMRQSGLCLRLRCDDMVVTRHH